MASIYTDEARRERYDRLRAKKKRLDKCLDIVMWLALIGAFIGVVSGFMSGVLNGVLYGNLKPFFIWLLDTGIYGVMIWAIYAKNIKLTLIAMGIVALSSIAVIAGGEIPDGLVLLIPVLIVDIQWDKLSKEEGFPLFDISFREYEDRERHQTEIARNRALAAGVRVATAEGDGADMGDILDAGFDKPVIAERIGTNMGRYAGSVQDAVPQREFTPGVMDELILEPADASAPPQPVRSVNTPELQMDDAALPVLDDMDSTADAPAEPSVPDAEPDPAVNDEILAALDQLGGKPVK